MAAHPGSLIPQLVRVILVLLTPDIVNGLQEYTFSALCKFSAAKYIDLRYQSSVFVTLDWVDYISSMDCLMHVTAESSHQIAVKFVKFDVDCSDSLTLYDGEGTYSRKNYTVPQKIVKASNVLIIVSEIDSYCGSYLTNDVTTTGNELTIELKTTLFGDRDGFKLLITAFKTGYCETDNRKEYKCNNGRCIDFELYCNGQDNCGDNSDYCYMDHNWWIWVIVGIVVFIIICVIITVICCCCCKKSRPGAVVNTNQGVTVHYNAGMQTAGAAPVSTIPGVNPWYGVPTHQPQYNQQNFYPPPQGPTQPPAYGAPPPFAAPPPSYTSVSGASVYPPTQPANPDVQASAPAMNSEKSAF